MARSRLICICGAVLSEDERDYYLYQCAICVMQEHEAILAHHRGQDHPGIDDLFSGPVTIHGLKPRRPRLVCSDSIRV
jgi:hypothetical protein